MTKTIILAISMTTGTAFGQIAVNGSRTFIGNLRVQYPNAASTGTTLNRLAKLTGAPSTAVLLSTSDTTGAMGIVAAGAGTTGSADIAFTGKALCVFDGATAANNYVQISSTSAGACRDAGATLPAGGQIIGRVTSTNGSGGTYEVDLTTGQLSTSAGGQVPRSFGATFDGGGSALTAGTTIARYLAVPYACTITAFDILVDSGTAGFKVWRRATGTALPTISDSINPANLSISTGTALHSTTLTNFTSTAIAANDIIGINLSAVSGATLATLGVQCL
jgi:hypothetical protein